MRVDDPLPFLEGKVHFTCGPSRTEAEHPQPGFGQIRIGPNQHLERTGQNTLFLCRRMNW